MFIYSVTVILNADVEVQWLDWMKRVHLPDVLRTGCFLDCRIYKLLEAADDQPTYVMQYHCRVIDDYYRYRDIFAAALQKEHSDRFAGRFRASRQVFEEIAAFNNAARQ